MSTTIPLAPVKSSQLHSIGYDPKTKTLAIAFHPPKFRGDGDRLADTPKPALYHYADFPAEEWSKFQNAASHGKHFYANIKGKYGHTRQ